MKTLAKIINRRVLCYLLALAFAFSSFQASALAAGLGQSDLNSIDNDTVWYSPGAATLGCTVSVGNGTTGSDTSAWNSGTQPPYYLEIFAVNVLEDLAQKTSVSQSSTVTQEHVVALVAWFWAEGGDIANNNLFNPLNTGLNDPDLLASSNSADGNQSFKSFDAGVEALALSFTGSNQDRIATALDDPSTTAEQVMTAITYYQKYPGNAFWAQADQDNQASYYSNLIANVEQARANYTHEAGTILGTTAHESSANDVVNPSLLQFQGGNSSGTPAQPGSNSGCQSGVASGSIVQTAIGLAWPDGGHGISDPTNAYQAAFAQYNHSTSDPTDCGGFVATVMIASGADTSYPGVYVPTQYNYVTGSSKYQITKDVTDTSQLQPGDILMFVNSSDPNDSHTFIYTGVQAGFNGDGAGASLGGHVPEAVNTMGEFSYNGRASSGNYTAARLINE